MFRDAPVELYTFNHKEVLKRKRDVVQTKKFKESMQQGNELAHKKRKKKRRTKNQNQQKVTKMETIKSKNNNKTKEVNHVKEKIFRRKQQLLQTKRPVNR